MLIMEISSSVLGDFFVHGGFCGFFYGLIGLRFFGLSPEFSFYCLSRCIYSNH